MRSGANTLFSSSVGSIIPPSGEHNWRPDVGGHTINFLVQTTGDDFMIVYQRESTGTTSFQNSSRSAIRARSLSITGVLGPEIGITGIVPLGFDHERPSVNQQARRPISSSSTTWMVVYQSCDNNPRSDDWDVLGKLVESNGQVHSAT